MKKFLSIIGTVLVFITVLSAACFAENTVTQVTAEVVDGKVIINADYSSNFENEFVSAAIYDNCGRLIDYFMVPAIPGKDSASIVIDDIKNAYSVKVFVMADKYSFEPIAEAEDIEIERDEDEAYTGRNYAIIGERLPYVNFVNPKTGRCEEYAYIYFPETGDIEIVPVNSNPGHYPDVEMLPHLYDQAIVTYEVDENGIYTVSNIGNVWSSEEFVGEFESEYYKGMNRDTSVLLDETDDTLEVYVDMQYCTEDDNPYVTNGWFTKNDDGTFRFISDAGWEENFCNFIVDENTVIIIAEEYFDSTGRWPNRYVKFTGDQLENANLSGHLMDAKYIVRNNPESTENEYLSYFFARSEDVELEYELLEKPIRIVAESEIVKKDNGMYGVKYKLNNPYTGEVETAFGKKEEADKYMLDCEKPGYPVVANVGGYVERAEAHFSEWYIRVAEYDAENGIIKDEDGEIYEGFENALIWRMGSNSEKPSSGYAKPLAAVTAEQLASKDESLYSRNTEFARPVNAEFINVMIFEGFSKEEGSKFVSDFIIIPVHNEIDIYDCDYEMDSKDLRIIRYVDTVIAEEEEFETATGEKETFYRYRAVYDFINPYTGNVEEDAGYEINMKNKPEDAEFRNVGEVVWTNKAGAIDREFSMIDETGVMWATGYDAETGELTCVMYGETPDSEEDGFVYNTDSETSVIVLGSHETSDFYQLLRYGKVKKTTLEKLAAPDNDMLARSAPYHDESDMIKYSYGKYPKVVPVSRPASGDNITSTEKVIDFIVVIANGNEKEEYCNVK